MNGRNDKWTDRAAAAAFAVVLGISVLWGQHSKTVNPGRETVNADRGDGAAAARNQENVLPEATGLPVLDADQKKVLAEMMECLEKQELKRAANLMDRESELLRNLFYDVLEGERYLYDGQRLDRVIEGKGMVLTMPQTLYYGTFTDGKPEGSCTAFQVVELNAPRYNYSRGQWKDGKMEGEGNTGYCYYEGSPEGEARDICKKGTFSLDLLDGEVIYTTMNGEGGLSTWKLTVKKGVTGLDDRWDYNEEREEYQLMSEDNDSHAYIMGGELASEPIWKNLLVWEE